MHAVDSLIDSMNLVYEDETEETVEDIFKSNKFPNPMFQRLFQVSKPLLSSGVFYFLHILHFLSRCVKNSFLEKCHIIKLGSLLGCENSFTWLLLQ